MSTAYLNSPEEKRCITQAVTILGDKWTPLLVMRLSEGTLRFGQLQDSIGINPRTLSARLSKLEAQGIIHKTTHKGIPPSCEYTLTQKGADLLPVLEQMVTWSRHHAPTSERDL